MIYVRQSAEIYGRLFFYVQIQKDCFQIMVKVK